jgi:hypothetical protein
LRVFAEYAVRRPDFERSGVHRLPPPPSPRPLFAMFAFEKSHVKEPSQGGPRAVLRKRPVSQQTPLLSLPRKKVLRNFVAFFF